MASGLPSFTPTQFASLAATLIQPACVCPPDARQWEGDMLFKVAFVLLFLWLLGMAGLYRIGEFLHALLLVGLMLLLMAFIKARDAARRQIVDNTADRR
jgi:hypothetical protein